MTPPWLAQLMSQLLGSVETVLDPACGTGHLLDAVDAPTRLGIEIDPGRAQIARDRGHVISEADALDLIAPDVRQAQLGYRQVQGIIANPPYVGEKGNAALFRRLRKHPGWQGRMAPRQDLQQLFLLLALELLEPGGELVFLMNPYWLTSDAGEVVRRHLDSQAALITLIDFGRLRLFEDAPGQHHLIVHCRKTTEEHATRFVFVKDRVGLSGLSRALEGQSAPGVSVQSATLRVSGRRARWYGPTPHDDRLREMETNPLTLGDRFETHQGVVSGADDLFLLNPEALAKLDLSPREQRILRRVVRARHIQPFGFTDSGQTVLYLDGHTSLEELPGIAAHLAPHRARLAARREVKTRRMPWFRLHWPRSAALFERPRILSPRRSTTPRFAMGSPGYCEQSDIALITHPRDDTSALEQLLEWLNGPEIALWCQHRGKHKGPIREYFGHSLEELPLWPNFPHKRT